MRHNLQYLYPNYKLNNVIYYDKTYLHESTKSGLRTDAKTLSHWKKSDYSTNYLLQNQCTMGKEAGANIKQGKIV